MKKLSGHPYLLFLEKTNCPFLLTKLTSPSWCFLDDDMAFAVVTLVPRTGAVRYIEVLNDWYGEQQHSTLEPIVQVGRDPLLPKVLLIIRVILSFFA